jgi:hypothetical protein
VTAVHAGDQPTLRAVEVVRSRGPKLSDDFSADEVNLEVARRYAHRQRVRAAAKRHRLRLEDSLLVGCIRVELGRWSGVADKRDLGRAVLSDGEGDRGDSTLRRAGDPTIPCDHFVSGFLAFGAAG